MLEAFYFHRGTNSWAGSGFCAQGYDVRPARSGRKQWRVERWSRLVDCLDIPDTPAAHELDGFEGRGTLVVNPLPDKAPTPIRPTRVKQPRTPPTSAPPPADLVLPRLPDHGISDEAAKGTAQASGHDGCTYYPGTQGWSGPYWTREYGVWYYVALEDCRFVGYLLGLRGAVAQNLRWIETIYYWDGYRPRYWYEFHNPEYSGTGGEVGACFAGSCSGHF